MISIYQHKYLNRLFSAAVILISLTLGQAQIANQNPSELQDIDVVILCGGFGKRLRKEIGEADLHSALFRALHDYNINDTGDFMDKLIESDGVFNAGQNEQLIRDVFAARGIDHNLDMGFPDIPYPQCP